MPKTPTGAKRPADVIGNAVHVMRVLTGEIEEKPAHDHSKVAGGKAGGAARAKSLSPEKKREIAKKAAKSRWDKA